MARISREAKEIAERNEATMKKYPSFAIWARKHLKAAERTGLYEKAFNYLSGGQDEQEAPIEL